MDCLFVRDGWRNAGVGIALLNRVVAQARVMKISNTQWQTPDWNIDASKFYRRQGATEILKRRFFLASGIP
jgi:GNAT superfamily N-acetyltransferase